VVAHDNRKWNCRADDLAKKYADLQTNPSKRASERNPRIQTVDDNNFFANAQGPNIPPDFVIQNEELPVLDPTAVPEHANLLQYYAGIPLIQIPAEHIGILCDLLATKIIVSPNSWYPYFEDTIMQSGRYGQT
jgi:hypothetical protein